MILEDRVKVNVRISSLHRNGKRESSITHAEACDADEEMLVMLDISVEAHTIAI